MYHLRSLTRLFTTLKMPAFTLYGARGSTNTDRVRLTLAEGGFTDYELVLLDLSKGQQKVGNLPVILLASNNMLSSRRNISYATHGAKSQQFNSPMASSYTKVAPSANTYPRNTNSLYSLPSPTWRPRHSLSKHSR